MPSILTKRTIISHFK